MAKKKSAKESYILIIVLIATPLIVMTALGFDKFDANEFRIITTTLIAEIVIYALYKVLFFKNGGKF